MNQTVKLYTAAKTGKLLETEIKFQRNWQEEGSLPQRLRELGDGGVPNNRYDIYRTNTDRDNGIVSAVMVQKAAWDALVAGVASLMPTLTTLKRTDDFMTMNISNAIDSVTGFLNIQDDKLSSEDSRVAIRKVSAVVPASPFEVTVGEAIDTLISSSITPQAQDLPNGLLTYDTPDEGLTVEIAYETKVQTAFMISKTDGGPVVAVMVSKSAYDIIVAL